MSICPLTCQIVKEAKKRTPRKSAFATLMMSTALASVRVGRSKTMKPDCWECKHFERLRMSAYCHGGKRVTKLPQKYWYSGSVKFCTDFEPRMEGVDDGTCFEPRMKGADDD